MGRTNTATIAAVIEQADLVGNDVEQELPETFIVDLANVDVDNRPTDEELEERERQEQEGDGTHIDDLVDDVGDVVELEFDYTPAPANNASTNTKVTFNTYPMLASKSARIRAMAADGVKTARIADALGIRYQHARNVLKAAPPRSPQLVADGRQNRS